MENIESIDINGFKNLENLFYSNIKSISWILLILTVLVLIIYSSWFFLGNVEIHIELKQELAKNLILRTVGFAMLGIPTTILITIIELFGIKNEKGKYRLVIKKLNLVISIILVASFVGSIIFFFR